MVVNLPFISCKFWLIIFINFCPQNANATFKAVKTTTADLTVANVNVKMDIQEFIATLTFQLAQST